MAMTTWNEPFRCYIDKHAYVVFLVLAITVDSPLYIPIQTRRGAARNATSIFKTIDSRVANRSLNLIYK